MVPAGVGGAGASWPASVCHLVTLVLPRGVAVSRMGWLGAPLARNTAGGWLTRLDSTGGHGPAVGGPRARRSIFLA